jgi:hypothetical protein
MDEELRVKKKAKFLEKFEESKGNVSIAAKYADIARKTYYNWIDEDKEFKQAANDVLEASGDYVESKLLSRINKDDTTAIIFYCKTKLKERGYVERSENIHDGNLQIIVNKNAD